MNDDTIQDLKQFIVATISHQTSDLATKDDIRATKDDMKAIKDDIKNLDDKLSKKIDDLSSSVAESLEVTHEVIEVELKSHDQRITKLEQKTV